MPSDELLGRRAHLRIARLAAPGAFLATSTGDDDDVILLPAAEVPGEARPGDSIEVFVHLDSDERIIATTRMPRITLGEVAFLEVTDVTSIGAFVDWGPGKELLVPFAEQSKELFVGERQPIGLYVDHSERLAGTMFVGPLLEGRPRGYEIDEWVEGESWRNDPDIGLFVIIERSYVGLVPASEPHRLRRGEATQCRVAHILPDGKLVLSLRQHAYQELATDAAHVLAVLRGPAAPRVGDRTSPDEIRDRFGLSKKAFKRAIGRLLKDGSVAIDADGMVTVARK